MRITFDYLAKAICIAVLMMFTAGCDNDGLTTRQYDIDLDLDNPSPDKQRVISFSPALTKLIVDMGKEDLLVGVAENDNAAPNELPTVGNQFDPNTEKLLELKPTIVLTMSGETGPPDSLVRLATSNDFVVINYNYPKSVTDVLDVLADENAVSFSEQGILQPSTGDSLCIALRCKNEALELSSKILSELDALTRMLPQAERPRTLILIGTDPVMRASGPGTVLHQLLTTYAGGENAAIPRRVIPKVVDPKNVPKLQPLPSESEIGTAPTFDREKLLAAQPDVILLLSPGAPALTGINEDPRLRDLKGLDIPAVKNNRIVLIDDPHILLAESSAMPRIAKLMARVIHPQLASQIPMDKVLDPSKVQEATSPTPGTGAPADGKDPFEALRKSAKEGATGKTVSPPAPAPADESGNTKAP